MYDTTDFRAHSQHVLHSVLHIRYKLNEFILSRFRAKCLAVKPFTHVRQNYISYEREIITILTSNYDTSVTANIISNPDKVLILGVRSFMYGIQGFLEFTFVVLNALLFPHLRNILCIIRLFNSDFFISICLIGSEPICTYSMKTINCNLQGGSNMTGTNCDFFTHK